jgi:hypothetical protein
LKRREKAHWVHGKISRALKAVVAAPIKKVHKVWGVIDFDTAFPARV